MTIPTLMQNHQRKVYVTQLHKVYNELSQALVKYQNDKNAVNLSEAGLNSQESLNDFVNNYFKTVQKCDNSLTTCFSDDYKSLNGAGIDFAVSTSYVLSNGVSIRPFKKSDSYKIASFGIDVNGRQGPNILGRDLFFIVLYKNGVLDDYVADANAPLTEDQRESVFTSDCMGSGEVSGWGCFGKLLNDNWEMTY